MDAKKLLMNYIASYFRDFDLTNSITLEDYIYTSLISTLKWNIIIGMLEFQYPEGGLIPNTLSVHPNTTEHVHLLFLRVLYDQGFDPTVEQYILHQNFDD